MRRRRAPRRGGRPRASPRRPPPVGCAPWPAARPGMGQDRGRPPPPRTGAGRRGPERKGAAAPRRAGRGRAQAEALATSDGKGLGSARLGSARLGSARLGSARLGSARLGSARLGSARLGSARLNYTGAMVSGKRNPPSRRRPVSRCDGDDRPGPAPWTGPFRTRRGALRARPRNPVVRPPSSCHLRPPHRLDDPPPLRPPVASRPANRTGYRKRKLQTNYFSIGPRQMISRILSVLSLDAILWCPPSQAELRAKSGLSLSARGGGVTVVAAGVPSQPPSPRTPAAPLTRNESRKASTREGGQP